MNIYLKTADKIIRNKYVITIIVIILLYQLTDTEGFRGKMRMLRQKHKYRTNIGIPHARRGHAHRPTPSNGIPPHKITSNKIPPLIIHKHASADHSTDHKHASADHSTDHKHMSGASVPVSFIPIIPSWEPARRHVTDHHPTYSGRNVNNSRWQDYLSFSWVPRLLGICKRGCTYLGKGQHGCTHPGGTIGDCQFASDCRWC